MNILILYAVACVAFGALYIVHGLRENRRRPR